MYKIPFVLYLSTSVMTNQNKHISILCEKCLLSILQLINNLLYARSIEIQISFVQYRGNRENIAQAHRISEHTAITL